MMTAKLTLTLRLLLGCIALCCFFGEWGEFYIRDLDRSAGSRVTSALNEVADDLVVVVCGCYAGLASIAGCFSILTPRTLRRLMVVSRK
jgi:hypothetical protein